jgi:DNA-binding GntR family transcriptional regulator
MRAPSKKKESPSKKKESPSKKKEPKPPAAAPLDPPHELELALFESGAPAHAPPNHMLHAAVVAELMRRAETDSCNVSHDDVRTVTRLVLQWHLPLLRATASRHMREILSRKDDMARFLAGVFHSLRRAHERERASREVAAIGDMSADEVASCFA